VALESKLTALLKGVCPRAYPDFAPNGTARPYVTYQQIGGDVINPLARDVPNAENAEMQITVWSDTRGEAKALIKQIEAALIVATDFTAKPRSAAASDFDADIPLYSSRQDFRIWCDRT
jgi:hypothetical protein